MARAPVWIVSLGLVAACEDEPLLLGAREFRSESIEGRELVPGISVWLAFGPEGELGAHAGCNGMWGTYELSRGRLALDGYLARTEKGCWTALGDLVAQENWFAAFLEADPYYELDEPRLTLSDDEVTLVMIDRAIPEPDHPLRRTRWIVSAYMRDGDAFAPAEGRGQLVFDEAGTVSIITPCATGSASYEADDATITLADTTFAQPVCPADEQAPMADAMMREVLLAGTLDFEIRSSVMTLTRGDVRLALVVG